MALTLSDVILGVRGRHPAFVRANVPDAAIARFLTGYQRELVSKALQKNREFIAQQMSVAFSVNSANAVGTQGAGTTGGRPVDADQGALSVVQSPMGTASEVDVDGDDIVTLVSESPVTSATANTLTKTGAGWTTNAYATHHVVIRAGTGQGQVRLIASNTATVLTIDGTWAVIPDTTSTFEVVDGTAVADETFGVVLSEPWSRERQAFTVKLDASGVPYLDLDAPVLARYDAGIPLPPMHHLISGDVRFQEPDDRSPLSIVNFIDRNNRWSPYMASVLGNTLYLGGSSSDWVDVTALDLRYVPVPPALARTSDYFLVPDTAYQPLVDAAAYHAAIRVQGLKGVPNMELALMAQAKAESEQTFLREVGRTRRAGVIRPWSHG